MYLCMLALPLAGYFGSVFSGYPIKYFGATLPAWGWKDEALKDLFSTVHFVAAVTLMALIAVHVGAALKHGLLNRDGVFQRMLPARSGGLSRSAPAARRQGV